MGRILVVGGNAVAAIKALSYQPRPLTLAGNAPVTRSASVTFALDDKASPSLRRFARDLRRMGRASVLRRPRKLAAAVRTLRFMAEGRRTRTVAREAERAGIDLPPRRPWDHNSREGLRGVIRHAVDDMLRNDARRRR